MTKAFAITGMFTLLAVLVIGFPGHCEQYSDERIPVRSSWFYGLQGIMCSTRPEADMKAYAGREAKFWLLDNQTETFILTSKGPKNIDHFDQHARVDQEKLTDEQLLHLNYLEDDYIIRTMDSPITFELSEEDSPVFIDDALALFDYESI